MCHGHHVSRPAIAVRIRLRGSRNSRPTSLKNHVDVRPLVGIFAVPSFAELTTSPKNHVDVQPPFKSDCLEVGTPGVRLARGMDTNRRGPDVRRGTSRRHQRSEARYSRRECQDGRQSDTLPECNQRLHDDPRLPADPPLASLVSAGVTWWNKSGCRVLAFGARQGKGSWSERC